MAVTRWEKVRQRLINETGIRPELLDQYLKAYTDDLKRALTARESFRYGFFGLGHLKFKVKYLKLKVRYKGKYWELATKQLADYYRLKPYCNLPTWFEERVKEIGLPKDWREVKDAYWKGEDTRFMLFGNWEKPTRHRYTKYLAGKRRYEKNRPPRVKKTKPVDSKTRL